MRIWSPARACLGTRGLTLSVSATDSGADAVPLLQKTLEPVGGLVQVPCRERHAIAGSTAASAAQPAGELPEHQRGWPPGERDRALTTIPEWG